MSDTLTWEKDGGDWPNRAASRFIDAGGLRWHVQMAGAGPVLLLLHGTGASTHSWRSLFPLLALRFQVVAPDLPGHGFTQSPQPGQLSLPGMARAVAAVLAEAGLRPVVVAGHSAGAAIALRMCLDGLIAPQAVIGINGALMPFGGLAAQIFSPMAKFFALNPLVPRLFAWKAEDRGAIARLIEGTGSKLDAEGLELYRRLFSSRSHVAATLGMMANWDLAGLQDDLKRLAPPLTLVVGENDKAVAPEEARIIRKLTPTASIVSLCGVGHLCHEERPAEVAGIIADVAAREGILAAA